VIGADKQTVNREPLRSGAAIREMNIVRRHLSAIKGGLPAAPQGIAGKVADSARKRFHGHPP
jgi:glycerate-2-kinase